MRVRKWTFPVAAVLLSIAVALPLLEVVLRIEYAARQKYKPSLAFVSDDLGWLPTPSLSTSYTKKGYEGEISYLDDEVGRADGMPVGLDKCLPRHPPSSSRCRVDAVLLEEVGHGGPGDAVSQIVEGALDSRVTPARILPSHHC